MRKIIQIAFETASDEDTVNEISSQLHALCDDGTIWFLEDWAIWQLWKLPPIPQDDDDEVEI